VLTAFFNPDIQEKSTFRFSQGLKVQKEFKKEAYALRLVKELYSLKQAPRLWNDAVNATLHRLNFPDSNSDHCLYVKQEKREFLIITLTDLGERI